MWKGNLYFTENRLSRKKCGVQQIIIVSVTYVQNNFQIRSLIKGALDNILEFSFRLDFIIR